MLPEFHHHPRVSSGEFVERYTNNIKQTNSEGFAVLKDGVMRACVSCCLPSISGQGFKGVDRRRKILLVVCGKIQRLQKASKRSKGDHPKAKQHARPASKTLKMAEYKADEFLMFDSAVSGRSAEIQVIYAYPNEYSVGITSLGYQLVCVKYRGQRSLQNQSTTWCSKSVHARLHVCRFGLILRLDLTFTWLAFSLTPTSSCPRPWTSWGSALHGNWTTSMSWTFWSS